MFFKELETERMLLKNISCEDREFIFSQFSDDIVSKYLFDAEPLVDIQGADEIIKYYLQPDPRSIHRWILTRKSDKNKMGTCGFHCWNCNAGTVEVGYDLKETFWGNGYMQEAMKEIITFAIQNMNIKRIDACVYIANSKSIAVVERLGFSFNGVTKNVLFRGFEYPHNIYSLNCAV